MSTKVFITGIQGFIGSHLKTECESRGFLVYGTTRADSADETDRLLESTRPNYIFHTAAELLDDTKMFGTNISLTQTILEFCKRNIAAGFLERLVVFGSSSEYGRKPGPMSEYDVLEPETIYEATKATATLLTRSYSITYKIPTIVIRPFTVYGPGEKSRKLIQILLKLPEKVQLSEGVHDYVYIGDFIDIVFDILYTCNKQFDIVNIGTGKQTTNLEVLRLVEKLTGHEFTVESVPAKPYDSQSWVCDTTYLQYIYRCKASTSLEDGLKFMI
jgi:nucleoside-diphosphate-sugar epimerase